MKKDDKCIIINKSDYSDLSNKVREKQQEISDLKREVEKLKNENAELESKLEKAHIKEINIKFIAYFEYCDGRWIYKDRKPAMICETSCNVENGEIIFNGKIKDIFYKVRKYVEKHWIDSTEENLIEYFKKAFDKDVYRLQYNSDKYFSLLSRVEKHNKKCWFKRNKIEV